MFVSIDQYKMLKSLTKCEIDHRYTSLIENVHKTATAGLRLHKGTNRFNIEWDVKQSEKVFPKIFKLEYMWKLVKCESKHINIERLNHLIFGDVLFW